jgi:hypothetical protein
MIVQCRVRKFLVPSNIGVTDLNPDRGMYDGVSKSSAWVDNETNNNKHSLRSNTKGYGGKTH